MSDDHQTGADLAVEFEHELIDRGRRVPIEVSGRLVGEQTGRARHQGAGNRCTLALPP